MDKLPKNLLELLIHPDASSADIGTPCPDESPRPKRRREIRRIPTEDEIDETPRIPLRDAKRFTRG